MHTTISISINKVSDVDKHVRVVFQEKITRPSRGAPKRYVCRLQSLRRAICEYCVNPVDRVRYNAERARISNLHTSGVKKLEFYRRNVDVDCKLK